MSLVVWVRTPLEIVRQMLLMAEVGPGDVVYDLGSGDGQILITAVKEFGAKKAVGYEIREDLCEVSEREIEQLNLRNRITVVKGNLLDADLSEASVIIIYLSPSANEVIRPKLEQCVERQRRVVSYLFPMDGWQVAKAVNLQDLSLKEVHFLGMLYLYHIPQAFGTNN